MKLLSALLLLNCPITVFGDIIKSSGDRYVDEALGLSSTHTHSLALLNALSILADVVFSEAGNAVPENFWADAKRVSSADESGDRLFKECEDQLYLLNPPINGTFWAGGSGPVTLIAITKTSTNYWKEPKKQQFEVLYWSSLLKKTSRNAMLIEDMSTFSEAAVLKKLGVFPIADPTGKPLDVELAKATLEKMQAGIPKEEARPKLYPLSEKAGIQVEVDSGSPVAPTGDSATKPVATAERRWNWKSVAGVVALLVIVRLLSKKQRKD